MGFASYPAQLRPLQSQANLIKASTEHFRKGFSDGYEYMFYEVYPIEQSLYYCRRHQYGEMYCIELSVEFVYVKNVGGALL